MSGFRTYGARRYNERVTLTYTGAVADAFGHPAMAPAVAVGAVWAQVRQMSATRTMQTFQQADVVGIDMEFRKPSYPFNGAVWQGHAIHFPTPEVVDERGRIVRVSGWYEIDAPAYEVSSSSSSGE